MQEYRKCEWLEKLAFDALAFTRDRPITSEIKDAIISENVYIQFFL